MVKRSKQLASWTAARLSKLAAWLVRTAESPALHEKFVDLAPTDNADSAGVYARALKFATENARVKNIALTGPYGSGKSSIIQTFLKGYPERRALHISLAAFVPETNTAGGTLSRQEIERSILQQLLYGADANRLPRSRFKRIQSPGPLSIFRSLAIMLGLISLWYIFSQRDAILNGSFFARLAHGKSIPLLSLVAAILFVWALVHRLYVASFGVSLKSISFKDIEMIPASDKPDSILNRHLDEIIYFFQATDYDVVVIEDLDRFDNADIFVTLREINGLVNKNAGVKRIVRFLYALRDDMFVNTDRTKFFEFIIPVIPIINASNSIDKVLEQGKRLALEQRLDGQFLREVSRYLNDLRLIQNIFNEYAIYVDNLESDEDNVLNPNKLLAILIYKNVYPRDFEQLHRGEGNLAGVLAHQDRLIASGEAANRAKIKKLEQHIEDAERQIPSDLIELRKIYAMSLVQLLPANAASVSLDRSRWITLQQLAQDEAFDQLIEAPTISVLTQGYPSQLNISSLQASVDPRHSYVERKSEIEGRAAAAKSESLGRINNLKSQIAALRTMKLSELLRLDPDGIDELFGTFGENGDLARYLILEGYLDDTYYQYTSLFHSGRLSPSDNKFLIQIRAFVTPAPDFPIDNPKEVIAAMRAEDFGQSYVLNVKLVDCLLDDRAIHADQLARLYSFVSANFETFEEFLQAYYSVGRNRTGLLEGLNSSWEGYVPAILSSKSATTHVTQLLANVPEASLKKLSAGTGRPLAEFVSRNLPQILAQVPEIAPERLACLGVEIEDLAAIDEHPAVVRFMVEEGRFETSITNLEYIYLNILGETDLEAFRTANFTTLRSVGNDKLLGQLERDFPTYFSDVLLGLDTNTRESADAVLAILQQDGLDAEEVETFVERQTMRLASLDSVPAQYHALLFRERRIEPTSANCLAFINSEAFDRESLIAFFEDDDVRRALLADRIPGDADALPLRQFIVGAAELPDEVYQEYVRALPTRFKAFPSDLDEAKLGILIDERAVTFSKESVEALADDNLRVRHVAANISDFLADPDAFELDDDFLEELLKSRIALKDKRAIVSLLDLPTAAATPSRAALVGTILDATDTNLAHIDATVARSLILNSRPIATQISLFNKLQPVLAKDDVRQILSELPRPFSEIRTGWSTPRLPMSPENLALVTWLKARKLISSWKQGGVFTDDIRINLFRH